MYLLKSKCIVIIRSSYEERMEDALALSAEEGRDKLRQATGNCK